MLNVSLHYIVKEIFKFAPTAVTQRQKVKHKFIIRHTQ